MHTDGKVKLGSKMGVTEMSNKMEDAFLADSKVDYITFCEEWMSKDYTPVRLKSLLASRIDAAKIYFVVARSLVTLCRCLNFAHAVRQL